MNIEMLYIFSRNSRLLNICENIYNVKTDFDMTQRASNIENVNLNPSKIAHFLISAKMYTRENFYANSRWLITSTYLLFFLSFISKFYPGPIYRFYISTVLPVCRAYIVMNQLIFSIQIVYMSRNER